MWLRVAQVLGIVAVIVVALLGALVFRLSQGPVSVAFLTPRIVDAVQGQLPPGFTARIADTVLERDKDTGEILLRLHDVSVTGKGGARVFAAPRAAIGMSAPSLLVGDVTPRSVWLIEPSLRLIDEGGQLRLETGAPEEPARERAPPPAVRRVNPVEAFAVLFALLGEGTETGRPGLKSLGARNATLTVAQADGTTGTIDRVNFGLFEAGAPDVVSFEVSLGKDDDRPLVEGELRREAGRFEIAARLNKLDASKLLPLVPPARRIVMTGPVSGTVSAQVDMTGRFDRFSTALSMDAGYVGFGKTRRLIDEIDLAFDWSNTTGVIDIHELRLLVGNSRGSLKGQVAVPASGDFSYGTLPLRLEFEDIVLDDPDTGVPAVYESASLEAFFVTNRKFLHISRLDVVGAGTAGSFVGFIGGEGESPGIKLAGSVTPTSVDALKRVWPPFLADKARRWFVNNALDGQITDGRLNIDMAPGVIAAKLRNVPFPRESIQIDFRLEDGVVRFLKQMPPIRGANVEGRVDALEFDVRPLSEAHIDLPGDQTVAVTSARFFVPDIPAKPSTGMFDVELEGTLANVLRLLDYPPVLLAERRNMNVDDFVGEGKVGFRMSMPLIEGLRFPDIDLAADGVIDGFGAAEFAGARNISDGHIEVAVADGRVKIEGNALVEGVRADILMEDSIDETGEPGNRSMTMTLDEKTRERMGIPLDSILSGPIVATIYDVEATPEGTLQSIETDLVNAAISFPSLGLSKPAGEAAKATFKMAQSGDRIRLIDLKVTAESLWVEGSAEFGKNGTLYQLDLPVLKTPRGTDLSVKGRTESGVRTFAVNGKSLDLRNILANTSAAAEEQGGGGEVRVALDVDKAIGVGGATLSDLKGTVSLAGSRLQRLDVSARTARSVPVSARYSDSGNEADMSVETADAGGILAWSGYYPHLRGGELMLTAARRGSGAPLSGSININNFRVAGDPSLSRLIEGGDEETGEQPAAVQQPAAQQRVNAMDVGFDRLTAEFERGADGLRVNNGVLRGVTVGATVEGTIDFATQKLALHGTYVPLYALNNLFGQLPLFLGPLLGGKKNEGLLGITYSLSGSTKSPVLTINPISVVAPGVFRYILGMDNPKAYSPGGRPAAVERSAPIR